MGFCDSPIERLPKSTIDIEFLLCCNSFFLQKYKAQVFHLGLNKEPCTNTRVNHWKVGGFMPCVIILIVRNTSEKCYHYWYIWMLKHFSHRLWVYIPLSGPDLKRLHLQRRILLENHSFSSMCQVLDCPEFLKKAVILDLHRFAYSSFSRTTALISSMKVSIKKLTFVEEHPIWISLILFFASKFKESESSKNCN